MLAKTPISDSQQPEGPLKLHSLARWQILRAVPNQEARAKESLLRVGFESYYGERRRVLSVPVPMSMISSKTRYRRRTEVMEISRVLPIFPGYIFVRRMYGGFDIFQAYELTGIIGLCCVGENAAEVQDFIIESLRLDEARGKFDDRSVSDDRRHIRQAVRNYSKPMEVKKNSQRIVGTLDESSGSTLFVESLGRITRIWTGPDREGAM
jgi:transcription antitermination factor NusG